MVIDMATSAFAWPSSDWAESFVFEGLGNDFDFNSETLSKVLISSNEVMLTR